MIHEPVISYFDSNGSECLESEDWIARRIDFTSSSRFFVKANRISRHLFNPQKDNDSDLNGKSGGRLLFQEQEVNEMCFENYMDFLETHNDLMYNSANSYRR